MNALQQLYVQLVPFLLLAALLFRLPGINSVKWRMRVGVLLVIAVVTFINFAELSLADCIRGVIGDLSVTTILLLCSMLVGSCCPKPLLSQNAIKEILPFVAVLGLILYPFALGLGPVDTYAFGFASLPLWLTLFSCTIISWHLGKGSISLIIILATICFQIRLLESTNMWDYLIDPLLVIAAWIWSIRCVVRGKCGVQSGGVVDAD